MRPEGLCNRARPGVQFAIYGLTWPQFLKTSEPWERGRCSRPSQTVLWAKSTISSNQRVIGDDVNAPCITERQTEGCLRNPIIVYIVCTAGIFGIGNRRRSDL